MALFGTVSSIAPLLAHDPRFTEAFAYLNRCLAPGSAEARRLFALPVPATERIPLAGGARAVEQTYLTRPPSECFFESHRKNIDVQFLLDGEEGVDVIPVGELEESKAYDAEKDYLLYRDPPKASRLILRAGLLAVFFPEDGHRPGLAIGGAAPVRKSVIKVPV